MIRRYCIGKGSRIDVLRRVGTDFVDRIREELGILLYQAIAEEGGLITTVTVFASIEHYRRALKTTAAIREALREFEVVEIHDVHGDVEVSRADDRILHPVQPTA